MFSYSARLWQTSAAKRGEFRFNGLAWGLSGAAVAGPSSVLNNAELDSRSVTRIELINSLHWTRAADPFRMKSLRNRLCSRFLRS